MSIEINRTPNDKYKKTLKIETGNKIKNTTNKDDIPVVSNKGGISNNREMHTRKPVEKRKETNSTTIHITKSE